MTPAEHDRAQRDHERDHDQQDHAEHDHAPHGHDALHGHDEPHGHGDPDVARADSAGLPWEGRTFQAHDTTFAGDDGSADPGLVAAIEAVQRGDGSHAAVLEAVRTARLLIPLIAHAGDLGETADGRVVDKTQELSIVTVAGPDGRTVMPAFTSVDAMRSWDPAARPIPVEARRVAMAAASEGTELVVLDPTAPTEFVLRRPAVWALGQDVAWTPSYEDHRVGRAVAASVAEEPAVVRVELAPGDVGARMAGPELIVGLVLVPGLAEEQLHALLGRLQTTWANDPEIAQRVDSLGIALRAAE